MSVISQEYKDGCLNIWIKLKLYLYILYIHLGRSHKFYDTIVINENLHPIISILKGFSFFIENIMI